MNLKIEEVAIEEVAIEEVAIEEVAMLTRVCDGVGVFHHQPLKCHRDAAYSGSARVMQLTVAVQE